MNLHVFYPILCLVLLCEAKDKEDYYKILGLSKKATINQIKKSYREKAKLVHPDKNKDPDAHKDFEKLTEAYQILSNPEKRKRYDRGELQDEKPDLFRASDIFSVFGMFQPENHEPAEHKGASVTMDLYVLLQEIYKGTFIEIVRNKPIYKLTSGTRKCNCRVEMVTKQLGPGRFQMYQAEKCDECPNQKLVTEEKMLEVEIERGVDNFYEYIFYSEGEPHIEGEPGDVIFKVIETTHPIFTRRKDDLFCNLTISLQQALIGFSTILTHLDGHKVNINHEEISYPGKIIIVKGQGMPNYEDNNQFGNLYITLHIKFPNKAFKSTEEIQNIKHLLNSWEEPPKFFNGIDNVL